MQVNHNTNVEKENETEQKNTMKWRIITHQEFISFIFLTVDSRPFSNWLSNLILLLYLNAEQRQSGRDGDGDGKWMKSKNDANGVAANKHTGHREIEIEREAEEWNEIKTAETTNAKSEKYGNEASSIAVFPIKKKYISN